VESALGQGAVFTIYFPRAPEDSLAARRDPASRRPTGSETILLAEDEPTLRGLVRTMLQRCGYTVLEAKDGREALRICREHDGGIDLLVSDMVMPGMNGTELAARAMALRPTLRILMVSGYTDDVICRHGIREKGIPFLQKPFAPDVLAQKVRDILDR
jgi:CheY-like chemotaxis protein